ncbi:MAG: long-chain fatty acid--CoA ligase [Gemmatimonadales bacterium]
MLGLMMDDYQLTLTPMLERARLLHGKKEVVSRLATGVHRYTFADYVGRVDRLAGALTALGVGSGDRVGTFAWNSYRHLEVYLGAPCMGAVTHMLNIRLFPDQLVYIINHAGDKVIFVDASLLPLFNKLRDRLTTVEQVVVMDDLGKGVDPADGLDYEALLAAAPATFEYPRLDECSAAAMCYTSGTTGNPKAVVYSHRSIVLHTFAAAAADLLGMSERDTILSIVPMFHANAWGLPYAAVMLGSKIVLPGAFMQPEELAQLISAERVSFIGGVPTIIGGLYEYLRTHRDSCDASSITTIVVGGAACPRRLMEGFHRDFGVWITHAWGMTETTPLGSVGRLKSTLEDRSEEEQIGYRLKQGVPAPYVEVRIVGESGEQLPHDGVAFGELQVRGPWIVREYYDDARNPECFQDGWFRTGDVANIDPEGYIQLVDRTKDVVKSGGEWISSVEIENTLMSHPAVLEAAVIAVAHPKWQERPLACVVLKPGVEPPGREAILEFLKPKMASWWLPDDIVFIEAIPKTSVGKFDKKVLRERYQDHVWSQS